MQEFRHVVGGHASEGGLHAILLIDGHILKPMQTRGRGDRERRFYESVWQSEQRTDEEVLPLKESECFQLQTFVPRYYGVRTVEDREYLELEDMSSGMVRPALMDIKIGPRTWGVNSSLQKKETEITKYPFQARLGFRYTGMKIYTGEQMDEFEVYDKSFGRTLTERDCCRGLEMFFSSPSGTFLKQDFRAFLGKVKAIADILEQHQTFWCFNSSLLIARESAQTASSVDDRLRVRLIDFAHSVRIGTDEFLRETEDVRDTRDPEEKEKLDHVDCLQWARMINHGPFDFRPLDDGHDLNCLYGLKSLLQKAEELKAMKHC